MLGRMCMLAVVGAAALVQSLPALPAGGPMLAGMVGTLTLAAAAWRLAGRRAAGTTLVVWRALAIAGCFLLAAGWALWQAQVRLDDALHESNDDKVSRVTLRVAALVREAPDSRRFKADILSSRVQGLPTRIEVVWHGPTYSGPYGHRGPAVAFPEIVPGQVWRMALNLRRVSGTHNPHGFDYEGHQFARGVRALGSVRGTPELLRERDIDGLSTLAEWLRHVVRQAMRPYLDGMPYAGVLLALTIGDQASIPTEQWEIFNRSGLTHLVSISGSHITMIAALGGWLVNRGWRRLSWRGRAFSAWLPAQIAACLAALLVAWAYCLLAGWGVPARRTFLMLSVMALAYVARLPLNPSRLFCLAAALVVLLDPWALMASGFWLSFGAVAVLFSLGSGSGQALVRPDPEESKTVSGRSAALSASTPMKPEATASMRQQVEAAGRRVRSVLAQAARVQLAISLALLPLLALWFSQLSLASPLANAYAIPVIGMFVTPLALLLALAALMPGTAWLCAVLAWAAHGLLAAIMPVTAWLADLPWAVVDAAAAPAFWMGLALLGLIMGVLPRGWPLRHLAWLAMLPALCWRPAPVPVGQWQMTALDVGQGASWVVRTAHHALVFDAGPRHGPDADAGGRVVLPYLRASGIRRIDTLVVSHADMDHVGGVRSLLDGLPVERAYTAFDLASFQRQEARQLGTRVLPPLPRMRERCAQGTSWEVDGVHFRFLWPLSDAAGRPDANHTRARNANSCVLWVQGAHHAALLPGDIGTPEETRLLALGLVPSVDVVMAAHHGSRHSSSAAWVSATRPALAIAQAGRTNRYGHPHADTVRRWQQGGSRFLSTGLLGAVQLRSSPQGLSWVGQRALRQRYWHGR